jgi:hypothetical protein
MRKALIIVKIIERQHNICVGNGNINILGLQNAASNNN